MAASVVLHCLPFLLLLHHVEPVFVTPSSVAKGNGDTPYRLVYLGPVYHHDSAAENAKTFALKLPPERFATKRQQQTRQATRVNLHRGNSPDPLSRAGTRYGTLLSGPTNGPEIRPALPSVFPDPPISRTDLPAGVQGDVIVEITIDKTGAVVDMKLLQTIGYGIEQKILATLQQWRFRPATMDGVPVDSKQDVHFHYPS